MSPTHKEPDTAECLTYLLTTLCYYYHNKTSMVYLYLVHLSHEYSTFEKKSSFQTFRKSEKSQKRTVT